MVFGRIDRIDAYSSLGNVFSVMSGRISYLLGLHGPSMVVDTACSGSLVALHLACQSLRTESATLRLLGVSISSSRRNSTSIFKSPHDVRRGANAGVLMRLPTAMYVERVAESLY